MKGAMDALDKALDGKYKEAVMIVGGAAAKALWAVNPLVSMGVAVASVIIARSLKKETFQMENVQCVR